METLGYFAAIIMGLTLGMLGGGGSILTVPILVYLFATEPSLAVSESLFIVGMTALVGSIFSYRAKEVDLKTVFKFAVPSFLGVMLMKKFILPSLPLVIFQFGQIEFSKNILIMSIFAILMVVASVSMIRKSQNVQGSTNKNWSLKILLQGFFVGNVTGLVGAGGGFLIVPALTNFIGLRMRAAVGSSMMIIAANSLFGFAVSLSTGLVPQWSVLLKILALSLAGLFLGRKISNKFSDSQLKKAFGIFVLVMGTIILIDQINKL